MISRILLETIKSKLYQGKAIILLGARQTGKTTLLKNLIAPTDAVLFLNADEMDVQAIFEAPNSSYFKKQFEKYKCVIIDEAQRISDIGLKLKLITDEIPELQLIATGSSAFELANHVNEPLTGRKWEYQLFPLSWNEMVSHHGLMEEKRLLEHRIVFGYYPDVVNASGDEKEVLKQLTDSYLYKDILMWEQIKKPDKIIKLLQALALQVGNEVSYNELAKIVNLDKETIEKYIILLEQTFIIFRLGALSRNLRKELSRSRKIYFYDNGIRNALIANFQPLSLRSDIGALWENFLISERIKSNNYSGKFYNSYFWRTQDQQEIDFIEEYDGKMHTFEFKWSTSKSPKLSKTFANAYPDYSYHVVNQDNYTEFISGEME